MVKEGNKDDTWWVELDWENDAKRMKKLSSVESVDLDSLMVDGSWYGIVNASEEKTDVQEDVSMKQDQEQE